MNKQDIINKLTNPTLDDYERESLNQMLHYLVAENKSHTSSNSNSNSNTNSHKRASDKRTSSNYKGKNPRHTSSTNTSSNTR